MPKIHQLPPLEAQKIAAGQVVERPANVVKELIENSIDAGSTRIEVYIEDAGQKLMRVSDNGCGMSAEDAQHAFNRHATSKLHSVNELPTITTFGFRGEALGSIAAVSTVTLITREEHAQEATKIIRFEEKNSIEQTHRSPGTDIWVENLFYNIPARKKFLKKPLTEWRQIQMIVQAFCLSYPDIHFKLFNDDKLVYNCPPVQKLQDRITALWEESLTRNCIAVPYTTNNGISVEGIITNHQYYRYDKNSIFLFVNNRWVKNIELARALIKGYMNVLPALRYPAAALRITVDPHAVDVNMHPRKEEVKFLHPHTVETFITQTIKKTLENNLTGNLPSTLHFDMTPRQTIMPLQHPAKHFVQPCAATVTQAPMTLPPTQKIPARIAEERQTTVAFVAPTAHETSETWPEEIDFTIIGQLHATYILLEQHDGLYIIDQHAAHERILYEQFKQERFTTVPTINLLFPVTVELSAEQIKTLEPFLPLLHEHGLHVELFGATTVIVKAAPMHVKHIAFEELIQEFITEINSTDILDTTDLTKALHEKIHAQMACKAAVKAGDTLTQEHMKSLAAKLFKTENRLTCPHGRPTGWSLNLYDIEKKFKRKL